MWCRIEMKIPFFFAAWTVLIAKLHRPIMWKELGLGLIPPDSDTPTTRHWAASTDAYRCVIIPAFRPLAP